MVWKLDQDAHQRLLERAIAGDKDIARALSRLHAAECFITDLLRLGKFEVRPFRKEYWHWRRNGGEFIGHFFAANHFDKVFNTFLKRPKENPPI